MILEIVENVTYIEICDAEIVDFLEGGEVSNVPPENGQTLIYTDGQWTPSNVDMGRNSERHIITAEEAENNTLIITGPVPDNDSLEVYMGGVGMLILVDPLLVSRIDENTIQFDSEITLTSGDVVVFKWSI